MEQYAVHHAGDGHAQPEAARAPAPGLQQATARTFPAQIGLLGLGVLALVLVVVGVAADSQNRLAVGAARHLANSALRVEAEQIGGFTRDYAFWNDAVRNLTETLDEAWAADNVGAWANDSLGMHATLVLGGNLDLIFGTADGEMQAADLPARFSAELPDLVAAARTAVGPAGDVPGVATSYLQFDGATVIAAAAAIKWEDARPIPMRDGAPVVLLFARRVDAAMLARFGELYLLPGLRLADATEDLADSVPLRSIQDREVARLAWDGQRPGSVLIRDLAAPLAGLAILATILMVVILRRARRSTAELARSHRQLENQTRALQASTAALQTALAEAARANAAKSDFLARMSHELRTPLNAILGFSEIIALELYGPHGDPRYRDYGRMIHDSGGHLRSLINDILDLAKIEAGRFELTEEPTDLGAIIDQCLGLLAPRIEAKGLQVDWRPSPVGLTADARALKQILLNLLSNAVKFTGDGGRLVIRATDGPDGIMVAVSDTGCGMTREDLERVFQMFGQARVSVARDAEGTGLGLNIAKGLMEMHGGSLTLESEPGIGTTATLWFDPSRRLASVPVAAAG